jgi:DNA-binding winged helix-turn-helix (wHTH) protein/TolB-like protein
MREVALSVGAAGGTAVDAAKSPDGVVSERTSASDHGKTPLRPIIFRAEGVDIDPQLGCVKRDGVEQPLRQQSFHVLLFLLARRFELVHKEELVGSFWHDAAVTDNALVQCIADIRRALGDDPRNPRFIKTVPRVGYRFVAKVDEVWPERSVADPEGLPSAALTDTAGAEDEGVPGSPPAGLSSGASIVTPGLRKPRFKSPKLGGRELVWAISGLAFGAFAFGLLYLGSRGSDFAISRMPGKKAVAVMYFDNLSGRDDLIWLREGLADMLITDLAQSNRLTVLSRNQLQTLLSRLEANRTARIGFEDALNVARRSRAEALITGSYGVLGDEIVINLAIHAVSSGQLLGADRLVMSRLSDVLGQMDGTARKMIARLSGSGASISGLGAAGNTGKSGLSQVPEPVNER